MLSDESNLFSNFGKKKPPSAGPKKLNHPQNCEVKGGDYGKSEFFLFLKNGWAQVILGIFFYFLFKGKKKGKGKILLPNLFDLLEFCGPVPFKNRDEYSIATNSCIS